MNLKDTELALTTEVDKSKPKYNMNKKQGFKGKLQNLWQMRPLSSKLLGKQRKQGQESEETF